MTEPPDELRRVFETADAFEHTGDGFAVTTTVLDAIVTARSGGDAGSEVVLTIRAPTLSAAAEDEIGEALAAGWLETFSLRLQDAPQATRHDVDLAVCDVRVAGDEVVANLAFTHDEAGHLPDIAKTFVEYTEGTYVEGVVPGFDYGEPVATLLGEATQAGGGERGGTPL